MAITRNTTQREIVYQAIRHMKGHATADMIFEGIHREYPSISKATVYRNIRILEKDRKILRISIPNGADYFEVTTDAHYHIKCTSCGRIFDASLPYMPELLSREQAADGKFTISSCSILFEGICPDCKEGGK